MAKTLILILIVLASTGCQSLSSAKQVADITSRAVYVDEIVRSGAIVDSLFDSSLSQHEISAMQVALKAYNDFSEKWGGAITKDPLGTMTKTSRIVSEYGVLRIHYAEIERIVLANWDDYAPENQYLLTEYRNQAAALDSMIMNLLFQSKTNTALMAIQKLGIVAGQIALRLI